MPDGPEASTSKDDHKEPPILLSKILKERGGYVEAEALKIFGQQAALIVAQEEAKRSANDRDFLQDYVLHVAEAKIADARLDAIVHGHTSKPLPPRPASPINTVQTLPSSLQTGVSGFLIGPSQVVKINDLALRADCFEGKSIEARSWIESYERMAKANDLTEATMIKYLPNFLAKSASDWFVTMCQPFLSRQSNWASVRNQFIRHYLGDQDYLIHRRRLQSTFQGAKESIRTSMPKCLLVCDMAYDSNKITEDDKIEQIMEKLLPEYQEKLALVRPRSLLELNDICLKLEQGVRASQAAARRMAN